MTILLQMKQPAQQTTQTLRRPNHNDAHTKASLHKKLTDVGYSSIWDAVLVCDESKSRTGRKCSSIKIADPTF